MPEPTDNPSPIDYRNPMHAIPTKPGWTIRRLLGWTVGVVLVVALLSLLFGSHVDRAREQHRRVQCASRLKQIGEAIVLYTYDYHGQIPPDFAVMLDTLDITSELFSCPSSSTNRAQGPTTQQVIANMLTGDHLSYAYVGAQDLAIQSSDIVVAFDIELHVPKDAATTEGINVLFGDGSVQFVNEKVAKAISARFNAGVRPIRLSDCDPTLKPTTNPAGGR